MDGGYAVAGWTYNYGAGNTDLLVLKLNSLGNLEWARTFGGTNYDYAYSIIQTTDGGYAVAGLTNSFGVGHILVLKLNSSGGLQWAKTFGGANTDLAHSIIQTTDGGYAVAGYTESFGAGYYDFLLIKLNGSGDLEWLKTFGAPQEERGYSVIQTSDDGYVFTGWTYSFGAGISDALVLRLNSAGDPIWSCVAGGAGLDYAYSTAHSSDGGYVIAGQMIISYNSACLFKLTSSGALQWVKTFGGGSSTVSSVVQTADGGYAIAGITSSFGVGKGDALVLKLGPDGNYPGCVVDCSPTVTTPTISTTSPSPSSSSPSVGTSCSPIVTTPTLTITDVCTPVDLEESDLWLGNRINCSAISGGILFNSPAELGIRIYSPDGRVAYSGHLQKGENRITLGTVVYLWQAGTQRGKAAVR